MQQHYVLLLSIKLAQEQSKRVLGYLLANWIQHSEDFHNDLATQVFE